MAHDKTALVIVALGGLAAMLLSRPSSAATPIVEPGGTDPYAIEPSYQPSDTSSSAPAAIAPGEWNYASSYDELAAQLTYDVTPAPDLSPWAMDDAVLMPPLETWGSVIPMATGVSSDFRVNDYPLYAQLIASTEATYGIPQDLLARLLWKESRYRSDIIDGSTRSSVGAAGIAQFMPATAQQYGLMVGGIDGRLDPKRAIPAAGRYLKALYSMFRNWTNAVAAYNWGPGNVQHYLAGDIDRRTGQAYVMPQETVDYVAYIAPGGGTAYV